MKGFTLIELLAVIVILGLIIGITVPTIDKMIEESRESTYKEQINQIENIARYWGVTNTNLLPDSGVKYYLSLEKLKEEGLLENKDILNPKDKSVMQGCVVIEFDTTTNQYVYTYNETCN